MILQGKAIYDMTNAVGVLQLQYQLLLYSVDGRCLGKYSAYQWALGIKCVTWSPSSQFLAIGSYDEKVGDPFHFGCVSFLVVCFVCLFIVHVRYGVCVFVHVRYSVYLFMLDMVYVYLFIVHVMYGVCVFVHVGYGVFVHFSCYGVFAYGMWAQGIER